MQLFVEELECIKAKKELKLKAPSLLEAFPAFLNDLKNEKVFPTTANQVMEIKQSTPEGDWLYEKDELGNDITDASGRKVIATEKVIIPGPVIHPFLEKLDAYLELLRTAYPEEGRDINKMPELREKLIFKLQTILDPLPADHPLIEAFHDYSTHLLQYLNKMEEKGLNPKIDCKIAGNFSTFFMVALGIAIDKKAKLDEILKDAQTYKAKIADQFSEKEKAQLQALFQADYNPLSNKPETINSIPQLFDHWINQHKDPVNNHFISMALSSDVQSHIHTAFKKYKIADAFEKAAQKNTEQERIFAFKESLTLGKGTMDTFLTRIAAKINHLLYKLGIKSLDKPQSYDLYKSAKTFTQKFIELDEKKTKEVEENHISLGPVIH